MIDKKTLKSKVRMLSIKQARLSLLGGSDAYVLNLKVFNNFVTCDVILIKGEQRERFNGCTFTFKELGVKA